MASKTGGTEEAGSVRKKIANLAVDPPKKNKDVDALKAMGGPFTSPHAVDEYV